MKHATLGASSSARWLNCTASVEAGKGYKNTSSGAAAEGTAAHELGELTLLDRTKPPTYYLGMKLLDAPDVVINTEMIHHINDYIDYIDSVATSTSTLMVEQEVSYSDYASGGFGTSDTIIVDADVCHIVDLKYGRGFVDVVDNSQLKLYALGTYQEFKHLYDFDVFTLHIFQPRINNIASWSISLDDLLIFGQQVKEASDNIKSGNTEYAPSDKACQWCNHKANCSALLTHTQKIIGAEFDDLDLPEPETVDYQLILDNKSLIESWLKAVEEIAFEKLADNGIIKGYKLVNGRSTRKWIGNIEPLLIELFGDDAFEKKILSPTKAMKLVAPVDKQKLEDLIIKPVGKPSMVKDTDKRQSISNVSNDFDLVGE